MSYILNQSQCSLSDDITRPHGLRSPSNKTAPLQTIGTGLAVSNQWDTNQWFPQPAPWSDHLLEWLTGLGKIVGLLDYQFTNSDTDWSSQINTMCRARYGSFTCHQLVPEIRCSQDIHLELQTWRQNWSWTPTSHVCALGSEWRSGSLGSQTSFSACLVREVTDAAWKKRREEQARLINEKNTHALLSVISWDFL